MTYSVIVKCSKHYALSIIKYIRPPCTMRLEFIVNFCYLVAVSTLFLTRMTRCSQTYFSVANFAPASQVCQKVADSPYTETQGGSE